DYMYRVYAHDPQARINLGIRRRLAPLLGGDRRMIELMNGLLFSMPGTPVLYYGDEIGMGDNIYLGDRNGVRTPMQWSGDRNAGFSRANPQSLYLPVVIDPEYHSQAVNVESQQNNSSSLFWWMKRLVALRRRYHNPLGRGSLEFLYPDNNKVLAFTRTYTPDAEGAADAAARPDETAPRPAPLPGSDFGGPGTNPLPARSAITPGQEVVLVVANLSRFMQFVELDLADYNGLLPIELFGQTELPTIGEDPYLITLPPHAFYWFALESQPARERVPQRDTALPTIRVNGTWEDLFNRRTRSALEEALPAYLMQRRWFGAKALKISGTEFVDVIPVPRTPTSANGGANGTIGMLTVVEVAYVEGDTQTYVLPLAATAAQRSGDLQREVASSAVARLKTNEGDWLLYDALWDTEFCSALLGAVAKRKRIGAQGGQGGQGGQLLATATKAFRSLAGKLDELEPEAMQAEQSNTSVLFGDRLFFKLFRRPEEGVNPDLEIGRFLTEKVGFGHVPQVAGALEYRRGGGEPMTVGILQAQAKNSGDAWRYTLDALGRFFEEAIVRRRDVAEPPVPEVRSIFDMAGQAPTQLARDTMTDYLDRARLLGQRSAELHLALGSARDDPAFTPEPITPFYQRSVYQTLRAITVQNFRLLRSRASEIPEAVQVMDLESEIVKRLHRVLDLKLACARIRCHGDYHLGQILYTGKDFVIIDFEGEPARPLSERRIKRSPLQDVAGMLRSLHYAAYSALYGRLGGIAADQDPSVLEHWVRFWYYWSAGAFLGAYLDTAKGASFLPANPADTKGLLSVFLLGKSVYELGYEANNRPEWIKIPIQGILQLLDED
ncbi:MAG: putative maltokinase, partial [Actinomycetota bacterium]